VLFEEGLIIGKEEALEELLFVIKAEDESEEFVAFSAAAFPS